jgi:hypothetical protein
LLSFRATLTSNGKGDEDAIFRQERPTLNKFFLNLSYEDKADHNLDLYQHGGCGAATG